MSRTLSPMPEQFLSQASEILARCQHALDRRQARQSKIRAPKMWRSFKASLYAPVSRQDDVERLRELLESTGYVVWGVLIDAELGAFGKAADVDSDAPHFWGRVMYCTNPATQLEEVIDVSDRFRRLLLASSEEESSNEPHDELTSFLKEISEGEGVNQIVTLPEEVAGERHALCVSLCIERDAMPQGFVRRRIVPLVIDPEVSDFAVLLDLASWPQVLKDLWRGDSYQLLREEGVSQQYDIEANPRAIDVVEQALMTGARGDFLIASLHELAGLLLEVSRREIEALLERVALFACEDYVDVEQRGELCRFLASFIYQGVSCWSGCEVIYDHVQDLALPLQEHLPLLINRANLDEEREAVRTFEMLESVPCSPRILLESFTSLVLSVVGERRLLNRLMADALLLEVLCKLAFYFSVLEPIEDLAGSLFDEDVTLIHVASKKGFVIRVDNVTTNDKLHELILEALSRDVEGAQWVKWRRYALDDAVDRDDLVMIESSLAMWNWAALRKDMTLPASAGPSLLQNEGLPGDIPRFEGRRVILLGESHDAQRWRVSGFYQDVGEPILQVKKKLTEQEVGGYLERIVSKGRLTMN